MKYDFIPIQLVIKTFNRFIFILLLEIMYFYCMIYVQYELYRWVIKLVNLQHL